MIRDHNGSFSITQTSWTTNLLEVHKEEGMGLLCALQWLQDWEVDHIVFELDCKIVVNAIHSSKINAS